MIRDLNAVFSQFSLDSIYTCYGYIYLFDGYLSSDDSFFSDYLSYYVVKLSINGEYCK